VEQEVLEIKSGGIVNSEAIFVDDQAGSLEEEGTAEVIQKTNSSKMPKKSDYTMMKSDAKKETALKDSPGLSEASKTPQQTSARTTITYKDMSEDSDIESVGVHKFVSIYSDQLEGLVDDEEHESIEKEGKCKVIEHAIRYLDKEDIFLTLFGKVHAREQ
jgi:hypothetical protein